MPQRRLAILILLLTMTAVLAVSAVMLRERAGSHRTRTGAPREWEPPEIPIPDS